jgi:N-acetylmuramoyl-L-alanine amidase
VKGSGLVDRTQVSPNHEPRFGVNAPSLLILHYTGMATAQASVDWLCNPVSKVSCHYLIDTDGSIIQMVSEDRRAWHAGTSSWHGVIDINSASIGIEIQNHGHGGGSPAFPDAQMQRVAALSLDIMQRHNMAPHQVLAHSDVAPGRKIDPGEVFDWHDLAKRGVGQMISASNNAGAATDIRNVQINLKAIGYGLDISGELDHRTRIVVEAFQRRYRRNCVDGIIDYETSDLILRLLSIRPDDQSSADNGGPAQTFNNPEKSAPPNG